MPGPDGLIECQLDGLPGPSHHFGGLSLGNLASTGHAGLVSHPRAAAQQCVALMRTLIALGETVGLLMPLARPDQDLLGKRGFAHDDLARAGREEPALLRSAWSSAAMWTANVGTVGPGIDSDGTTRLVIANLLATVHRAQEAGPRTRQLRQMLAGVPELTVLDPLPAIPALSDEGAANHTRFAGGVHLFVHGRDAALPTAAGPHRFPARQTLAASRAVAHLLRLPAERVVHARQHPDAIDAGAFHNDVVMVGRDRRLLMHEQALVDQPAVLAELAKRIPDLRVRVVRETELSLAEAVASYLFNGQLLADTLVVPAQCTTGAAKSVCDALVRDGFVAAIRAVDVDQSMANGGGPACLRLRLPLRADQVAALPASLRLDSERLDRVATVIEAHWPRVLSDDDLVDPGFTDRHTTALAALAAVLEVPC